jgi:transcriptional regulator with XRE-family HTH domain
MTKQVSLGERVKQSRHALKITQQELARAVGITPQHISAIEQGKWAPSISLLPKLAEELGVSIDYLVSGRKGIITDTIPAIKADKSLPLEIKRALIALVNNSRNRGK